MGEVWLAERGDGERVALKLMSAELEGEGAARFAREIEILAGLDHPGIARARSGLEQSEGTSYYAMELVLGRNLAVVLAAGGPLPAVQATSLCVDVLEALGAAHEAGVVHRDVKPSNVLLDRSGRARLTDFGLARACNQSRLTAEAALLGTPTYMSPEQAEGREATPASDLYAVGVMLFELLAGAPPYQAEQPLALLRQHVEAEVPDLAARAPEAAGALAEVARRALQKDPAARYPSAAAMARALAAVHAPVAAGPGSTLALRVEAASEASPAPLLDQELAVAAPPSSIAPPAGPAWGPLGLALLLGGGLLFALAQGGASPPPVTPPGVASPRESRAETRAEASPSPSARAPAEARVQVRLRDGTSFGAALLGFGPEGLSCRLDDGRERLVPPSELLSWDHEREDSPR